MKDGVCICFFVKSQLYVPHHTLVAGYYVFCWVFILLKTIISENDMAIFIALEMVSGL